MSFFLAVAPQLYSSETALAEMIVIFRQTGLLEQCQWHMHGLGVLVQVPLNFPERRITGA
jgi:hypothetical protein